MSAIVLDFVRPKKATPNNDAPHYFCQKCEGDKFKAFQNGRIHCASCGSGIKNLTVTFHPEPA